jgi:hypothetical protein
MAGCVFYLVYCKFFSLPCRPVTRPQGGLGSPPSPSRTRSPEPQVVGKTLADDARTATPPRGAVESRTTSLPVAATRVETPPRAADAGGTSAGDFGATTSQRSSTPTPSVQSLVGRRTWSGTSLNLTWCQEVQRHLAHRYLRLHPRAQGCHDDGLTGITPLGRRTGLKITRTCRPCGPASSPSITRRR